jgi:excisionase family DNA binding protein
VLEQVRMFHIGIRRRCAFCLRALFLATSVYGAPGGSLLEGRDVRGSEEALWSVDDIAEYLAMLVRDVHELVAQRSIPHLKIGEHLRFRRGDIDRWLDLKAVPCAGQASRCISPPVVNAGVSKQHRSELSRARSHLPQSTLQTRVPSPSPVPLSELTKALLAPAVHPGRSGPEGQSILEVVKQLGKINGFRVTLDQQILDGQESVDVVLERDRWKLACEVVPTTVIEQEIGRVKRYLASGFDVIAIISTNQEQTRRLEPALARGLTKEELARVKLLAPEELSRYIEGIETLVCETVNMTCGYKVTARYYRTNPADEARRRKRLAEILARHLPEEQMASASSGTIREENPWLSKPPKSLLACVAHPDRGGPGQTYLKEIVKRFGEAQGFQVTSGECNTNGSVDLVLERGWRLAFRISLTGTVEQEMGDIQKCLAAGFNEVAVVLPKLREVRTLKRSLAERLKQEDLARVRVLLPGELPLYIEGLEIPVETVAGHSIKARSHPTDPADEARRQRAAAEIIGRGLRSMRELRGS